MIGDLVVKRENVDLLEAVALEEAGAENKEEGGPSNAEGKDSLDRAVIEVTEANLLEYAIEDVVMPMISHSVRMPPNSDLAAIYADLL